MSVLRPEMYRKPSSSKRPMSPVCNQPSAISRRVISGGMNVFPAEIEAVQRQHPAIADVADIGLPDEKWGETVCALVEAADGAAVDEADVIAFCTERLASYKKPTSVRVVDELPRTAVGKLKKFLLRDLFASGQPSAS